MKSLRIYFLAITLLFVSGVSFVNAQEEESSPFDAGVDLFSSYVWRGSLVHGPSLQPWASVTLGGFEVGAWGAYEIVGVSDVPAEADLYLSYGFDFGLSIGLSDYYYPGGEGWFQFNDSSGTATHAFEINAGYEYEGLSLSGNYVLNEAGWAASKGGDLYFELGYSYKNLSAFIGLGNGWHTNEEAAGETAKADGSFDDKFALCNIGAMISKEVGPLPLTGGIVLNPYTKDFHVVAGISF